jgi:DegV family protein with EDD domain
MAVRIVTDSTCDLPAEMIARYDIGVVPLYINVGKQGFLDGVDITRDEFYAKLPTFPVQPTTAVPSPNRFRALYDALAETGASHILSIHVSASLSSAVEVARLAARETASVAVTVLDSGQLSIGTGFLAETAARMVAAGSAVPEIVSTLNDQIKRTHTFAALDTLEFLKRSGRMNRYLADFANLLQIKPIISMHAGKAGTQRVRTREHATRRLLEMLQGLGKFERAAIVHTCAPDRVAELRALAAPWLPAEEPLVATITPVIGAHVGPGVFGFSVVAAAS